jgi:cystathionine beta-lyase/cystathionine gamma-synthase
LEQTFAEIEGGSHAAAFSSGMAAATAVLLAMPQCFVVLPDDLYHGVHEVMDSTLAPWGARWVKVDMTNEQVWLGAVCYC